MKLAGGVQEAGTVSHRCGDSVSFHYPAARGVESLVYRRGLPDLDPDCQVVTWPRLGEQLS